MVHARRWPWHREVLPKLRGQQQPGEAEEATRGLLCPLSLAQKGSSELAHPSPGGEGCRQQLKAAATFGDRGCCG